jgi:hypothetical protein
MRLKSSGTSISPARNPSRRGFGGAYSAATFTSGLPGLGDRRPAEGVCFEDDDACHWRRLKVSISKKISMFSSLC